MERVIRHINQLLKEHDFLAVMGIGGFVVQRKPAELVCTSQGHQLLPPRREVTFNPLLQHNDGVLVEVYMKNESMRASEAEREMRADIDRLISRLKSSGEVQLGAIGALRRAGSGIIEFCPSGDLVFSPSRYGLVAIELTPIATQEEKALPAVQKPEDTIHFVFSRKRFYRTVGSVAAILLLGLLSIPITLNDARVNKAKLLPTMVESHAPIEIVTEPIEQPMPVLDAIEPEPDPQPVKPAVEAVTPVENRKTFYLVVASCTTSKEAKQRVASLVAGGYSDAGSVDGKERSRVYTQKFFSRQEAEAALGSLRREKKEFETAWLFISR